MIFTRMIVTSTVVLTGGTVPALQKPLPTHKHFSGEGQKAYVPSFKQ